jgi:hypothetical protein
MSNMKFYNFIGGPYNEVRLQLDLADRKEIRLPDPKSLTPISPPAPLMNVMDPPAAGSVLYRLEKRGNDEVFVFVSQALRR